jgi:hypothetical protein
VHGPSLIRLHGVSLVLLRKLLLLLVIVIVATCLASSLKSIGGSPFYRCWSYWISETLFHGTNAALFSALLSALPLALPFILWIYRGPTSHSVEYHQVNAFYSTAHTLFHKYSPSLLICSLWARYLCMYNSDSRLPFDNAFQRGS